MYLVRLRLLLLLLLLLLFLLWVVKDLGSSECLTFSHHLFGILSSRGDSHHSKIVTIHQLCAVGFFLPPRFWGNEDTSELLTDLIWAPSQLLWTSGLCVSSKCLCFFLYHQFYSRLKAYHRNLGNREKQKNNLWFLYLDTFTINILMYFFSVFFSAFFAMM